MKYFWKTIAWLSMPFVLAYTLLYNVSKHISKLAGNILVFVVEIVLSVFEVFREARHHILMPNHINKKQQEAIVRYCRQPDRAWSKMRMGYSPKASYKEIMGQEKV